MCASSADYRHKTKTAWRRVMLDFAFTIVATIVSLGVAHALAVVAALAAFLVLPRPPIIGGALGIVAGIAVSTAMEGSAPSDLPLAFASIGTLAGFVVRR